jgi:hypothetical protein
MAALLAAFFALPALQCAAQKSEDVQVSEQAPPPSAPVPAAEAAPAPPPEPAPPPPAKQSATRPAATIPEERPRRLSALPPAEPATVTVTIPQGTSVVVHLAEALTSETALVGDDVTATLSQPIIVGDRVAFPAGSQVKGRVTDVKSASKGFTETGGALAISFDRIVAADGHSAAIAAAFTKLATGSGKKKAAIIGGSAVGGALLGKVLGKDAKGAAVIGGAVGTAVAGATKGKEAIIAPEEEIVVNLERAAPTTMKR